jgi:hypothetical protein
MPDLNSNVLEVVIALAFVYFLLSTVSSAITEAIAWLLQRRAKDLEAGLRSLLADDGKTDELLEHPLIEQFAPSGWRAKALKRKSPSYISARTFASALLDTIAPQAANATGQRNVLADVRGQMTNLPDSLKKQLLPLLDDAQNDLAKFRGAIEGWFDDAMARVSGWYRRWAQVWICLAAAAVTIAFNVDTLRIADRLWNDDALRQSTVGAAVSAVNQQQAGGNAGAGTASSPEAGSDQTTTPEQAVDQVKETTSTFTSLQLPVGWSGANDNLPLPSTAIGWLITFLAVSLGAPFWFDALSKLARLRTTGPPPSTTSPPSSST